MNLKKITIKVNLSKNRVNGCTMCTVQLCDGVTSSVSQSACDAIDALMASTNWAV